MGLDLQRVRAAIREGRAPALGDERWDELDAIAALRSGLERCSFQRNTAFETDAELLDVGSERLLAVTMDTLQEDPDLRVAAGPYDVGWLAVTISLSDLAAVGAEPVAVLVACSVPPDRFLAPELRALSAGADAAARAGGAFVVGGDTNAATQLGVTTCALGWVGREAFLRRTGARPGDGVWVTGPIGTANRLAVLGLLGARGEETAAAALSGARCAAGRALAGRAAACIDTSDGVLGAALGLGAASGCAVELEEIDEAYDPIGLGLTRRLGLPSWLLAAGEWGEYELLYAAAAGPAAEGCVRALAAVGVTARRIGRCVPGTGCAIRTAAGVLRPDMSRLRRLFASLDPEADLVCQLRGLAAACEAAR